MPITNAAAAGFVLFQDVPTVWTLAGAGVVVASTLYITWREQQLARRRLLESTPPQAPGPA